MIATRRKRDNISIMINIFSDSLKTLLLTAQMDWCLCGTFLVLLTTQRALTLQAAFTHIFCVLSSMHTHTNACLRCIFRFDILACGLEILGTGPLNIQILSRKISVPEPVLPLLLKSGYIMMYVLLMCPCMCQWGLIGIRCFLTALGNVNNACLVTEGQMQG